jgi:hypothetical protein
VLLLLLLLQVAADDESADAWVDALLLANHLARVRSSDALGEALAPAAGRRGPSLRPTQ